MGHRVGVEKIMNLKVTCSSSFIKLSFLMFI